MEIYHVGEEIYRGHKETFLWVEVSCHVVAEIDREAVTTVLCHACAVAIVRVVEESGHVSNSAKKVHHTYYPLVGCYW